MKKVLVLISLIFLPTLISAQELDATVSVNVEQLEVAARDRLDRFQNQIQDYLNNTKFTKLAWEGEKIKCSFNIFFISAGDEVTYSTQLVVTSQRPVGDTQLNSLMMKVLDNSWSFKYEKNQSMYFNHTDFDPLTSLLDFYAYIIIGFDNDSFNPLAGTDQFQKALDIAVRGGSSSFPKGWQLESSSYNRRALVDNLLNGKYQQFRQDFYDYHWFGIDLVRTKDRDRGINNIVKLIKNLEKMKDQIDWRSVLLKVFFDAKVEEMTDYLKKYTDKSIFQTLRRIDAPHTAKYDEAVK